MEGCPFHRKFWIACGKLTGILFKQRLNFYKTIYEPLFIILKINTTMNHQNHSSAQQNNNEQTSQTSNSTQQDNCTVETCTMNPCPMKTESKDYHQVKCPVCGKSNTSERVEKEN